MKYINLLANTYELNCLFPTAKIKSYKVIENYSISKIILEVNNEKELGEEGCLSFPDLWLKVERSKSLIAKYLDNMGQERIIQLEGLDARCFLHELDHLDGVCFTDGLSPLKLAMAIKKQRKLNGRTK